MKSESSTETEQIRTAQVPDPRRWKALAVLGVIQYMLVLDMTVVNVALPRIQHDLGFSHSGLAWVVNGYTLMAGGLLLLGGRLADIYGRRALFLTGVTIFAVSSILCGVASSPQLLVSSRFSQGIGEALAAPASLGLIALLFPDPRERMKALGIWGGVGGFGAVSGSVISGVLTDLSSWRWIFFINVPFALIALAAVPRLVSESRMVRDSERLDLAGAAGATVGLVALVDGLLQAANHPWGSSVVLFALILAAILLLVTGFIEARSPAPLIPLGFFRNRTRVVANIAGLPQAAAFFAYIFLLTLFEQQVLRYTPLDSGLSYLPFGLAFGAGLPIATALMPRLGVRFVMGAGILGSAGGVLLTSLMTPDTTFVRGILPGMLLLGVSSGVTMPAFSNASLHKVDGQDSSLAAGVQNAMQAVGGALGLACLVTLALRHTTKLTEHGMAPALAATRGYCLALRIAAGLMVLAAIAVFFLMERQPASTVTLIDEGATKLLT